MAEYIEREELLHMMGIARYADDDDAYRRGCNDVIDYLTAYVKLWPAADVVEMRHGKWCLVEYEYLTCDKCGNWYYTGCESTAEAKENLRNGDTPNYCHHCGAKMDGEDGADNDHS